MPPHINRPITASAPAHTSAAARQIVGELRSQYFMAFEASGPEGWHPLAVRTGDPKEVQRVMLQHIVHDDLDVVAALGEIAAAL